MEVMVVTKVYLGRWIEKGWLTPVLFPESQQRSLSNHSSQF